jgi:hypothetical protein
MSRRKLDPDHAPIPGCIFRRRLVDKVGIHLRNKRPNSQQVSRSEPIGQ